MPLFPRQSHLHVWRYTRSLLRACYLLLLSAGAVMNLVLVLIWHPTHLCHWDIDISWYTSTVNTTTSPCHGAPFIAWITAAILRVVMTSTMAVSLLLTKYLENSLIVFASQLSFIYTLRSYYRTRHPNSNGNKFKYSPYFLSDPEDISPVPTSSPLHLSKSPLRLTQSEDSSRTLNQSNPTLPKYNSVSTLAPSTSCTGHSRSHSAPSSNETSPPRISPPTSRKTSGHATNHRPTQFGSKTPSQTQPVNAVTPLPWASRILRRASRISVTPATSDTMLTDISLHSEKADGPMITRDSPEIQSRVSWKPSHRGSSVHLDGKKTPLAWENAHGRHASQPSVGPQSFTSTHDGESTKEKDRDDDDLMYSYGYGASGPTYPYLDMYNPQGPGRNAEVSSYEDVGEHRFSQGFRRVIPGGPAFPEVTSEPRSSLSGEEEESSGEEEEYVAMMGGFVRRMATIESLGSKEAAGTLSTTGSVALHPAHSRTSVSQFSLVRFAEPGSSTCTSSLGVPLSREGSLSTAYLSFSSGGTGMRVNERGELSPGSNVDRSAAGSPHYHTATSGSSFPRVDDEDR